MGIRQIATSPCYPLASLVEHLNYDLKAIIVIYDNSRHTHWLENLSPLAEACNSSWHKRLLHCYFWVGD
jgi:hypothetical protein